MQRLYGRIERIRSINAGELCKADGCKVPAHSAGYCRKHYIAERTERHLEFPEFKRTHPLYSVWFERKTRKVLSNEWLNFWAFVKDVGARPSKNHALVRLHKGPYGPTNFQWREHLRRKPGESKKAWYARKWQARKLANPGWDSRRTRFRKYGITDQEYDDKRNFQNDCCAICRRPETDTDYKTGNILALAVDHCHKSGKVRDLLCRRCNHLLGMANDDVQLLQDMIAYLNKHKE